jgi:hypothetical protein
VCDDIKQSIDFGWVYVGCSGLSAFSCLWHLKLLVGVGALKLIGRFTEAGKWEFAYLLFIFNAPASPL